MSESPERAKAKFVFEFEYSPDLSDEEIINRAVEDVLNELHDNHVKPDIIRGLQFKHRVSLVRDIVAPNRKEAERISEDFWRDDDALKEYRLVCNEMVLDL